MTSEPGGIEQVPNWSLDSFASQFGLNPAAVGEFVKYYNSQMGDYGNEIYALIETRIAHWANFLDRGWFTGRLDYYLRNADQYDTIVDLGFSAPYPYADAARREDQDTRYVFVDREESSRAFYEGMLHEKGLSTRAGIDTVVIADIEDRAGQDRIVEEAGRFSPSSLLVVASEVIEHLGNPERAWALMSRLHGIQGLRNVMAYVTLPVGKQIPSHTLEFKSEIEATGYLERHMRLSWVNTIHAPPDSETLPFLSACVCAAGTLLS